MTRKHLWAFFSLGVWFAGTIAFAFVTTQNFYTVDRLIAYSANESFREAVERMGADGVRELFGYLSSELNRLCFQWWNALQLLLGTLILGLLRPLKRGNRAGWLAMGMLAVTLFLSLGLTPAIIRIGRELDFVPRNPLPPSGLRTLGLLNAAYSVFTLMNMILGVLTIRSLLGSHSSENAQRASGL